MENIDHKISHAFADAVQRSRLGRKFADIAAAHLLWFIGGMYAVILLLIWKTTGHSSAQPYLFSVLAAWTITILLEYSIRRKRPFQELSKPLAVEMLWIPPSFPSGHATIAFAIATTVAFIPHLGISLAWALYVLAVLISVGRVAVRAHYVTDVIAGAIVGVAVPSIIFQFLSYVN